MIELCLSLIEFKSELLMSLVKDHSCTFSLIKAALLKLLYDITELLVFIVERFVALLELPN